MKLKVCLLSTIAFGLEACASITTTPSDSSNDAVSSEDPLMYRYGDKEKYQDFLSGEVVYNEVVMLVEENGKISGNLLYEPTEIISVKDYSLEKEYASSEFEIEGRRLVRTASSTLPYLSEENLRGENLPNSIGTMAAKEGVVPFTEGPGLTMLTVNVTYAHKEKWDKEKPIYQGNLLPNAISKLKNKEPLRIGFYGDSIMTGCNSSGKLGIPPYLDDFPTAATEQLKDLYGYQDIEMFNSSKGGMLSDWGETNVASLVNYYDPDLVFLGFGMNDGSWNVRPDIYVSHIETMLNLIQAHNQGAEVVVVATILANPDSLQNNIQDTYLEPLKEMLSNYEGVSLMDMTTYSKNLLSRKRSFDLYANNINHPNDFMVRGYVSNILTLLAEDYR